MTEEKLVLLLRADAALRRSGSELELIDVVLDELGVPSENSRTYAYNRDVFIGRWVEILEGGRDQEIENYPGWVKRQQSDLTDSN